MSLDKCNTMDPEFGAKGNFAESLETMGYATEYIEEFGNVLVIPRPPSRLRRGSFPLNPSSEGEFV